MRINTFFCRISELTVSVFLQLDYCPHFAHLCLSRSGSESIRLTHLEENHAILPWTQDTTTGPNPGVCEFNPETFLK
jgi:hypothetical protein